MFVKVAARRALFWILALLIGLSPNVLIFRSAQAFTGNFAFPIIGGGTFSNDFNAPRSNSTGIHHAIDIFAPKQRLIIAAVAGTITFAPVPEPSYGYMVTIRDDEGYKYNYIHINNDTPGTDDGQGGPMHAYAAYVKGGNRVYRGQHIGYVGDSGNAENTAPHLHFEVQDPDGNWVNPYDKLRAAKQFTAPVTPFVQSYETLPYGNAKVRVNVAAGNTDGDQASELLTAPGSGIPARVKLFDNDRLQILGFNPYPDTMTDGLDVALGDVDGDGQDEIITAAGPGSGPEIRIFNSTNATQVSHFFAFPSPFKDGLHITAGDVDGDGDDEIIVVPGPGSGPQVKIFEPDGSLVGSFFTYVGTMRSGLDVAAGNMDGDNHDEIIVVPGPGDAPLVRLYEAEGTFIREFRAYEPESIGKGVRLDAGNARLSTATDEIVTVPASEGVPGVRMYDNTGDLKANQSPIEKWWIGYHDVAVGRDYVLFGTGVNRRGSIMEEF